MGLRISGFLNSADGPIVHNYIFKVQQTINFECCVKSLEPFKFYSRMGAHNHSGVWAHWDDS
jgi:hypothetical protein